MRESISAAAHALDIPSLAATDSLARQSSDQEVDHRVDKLYASYGLNSVRTAKAMARHGGCASGSAVLWAMEEDSSWDPNDLDFWLEKGGAEAFTEFIIEEGRGDWEVVRGPRKEREEEGDDISGDDTDASAISASDTQGYQLAGTIGEEGTATALGMDEETSGDEADDQPHAIGTYHFSHPRKCTLNAQQI
jgi:hypothetical protein